MDLRTLAYSFHNQTAKHGLYLLVAAVLLVVWALLMIGLADQALYKFFGIGLLVTAPMLGFKGLQIRNLSRYHEKRLIPQAKKDDLWEQQESYVAAAAHQQDHQKRKSTFLMIGLMLCCLVGAVTEFAVLILVSALAMFLVVAIEYCYAIVTEFRLSAYQVSLQRLKEDQ